MDAAAVDRLEIRLKMRAYIYRLVVGYFPSLEDIAHLAEKHHWTAEQHHDAQETLDQLRDELVLRADCLDPVRT